MASIEKRPNGKWRARYRDIEGKQKAKHFDRKADAQKWLDETTTSVLTGRYVDPNAGKMTFTQYYDQWSVRQLWAAGTRKAMTYSVKGLPFADIQLRNIRKAHIETWIKSMSDLAPTTVRTRYNNVRSVFRAAVDDRMIPDNPTQGVTLPRTRRTEAAMSIPTPREVGTLIDKADEGFKCFVALAAFAGLRMGEICGLQPGDFDFSARTLTISRQSQRKDGAPGPDLVPPKYGSERVVFLPDELITMVRDHIRDHGDGTWLFHNGAGLPLHQNPANTLWRKARTAAGTRDYTLHEMRHFYASGLIAMGCDVVTVQRALGHASASVTLNTYAHLWPSAEDRTRAAAGEIMAAATAAGRDVPPFAPELVREGPPDWSAGEATEDQDEDHTGKISPSPADGEDYLRTEEAS